MNKWWKQNSRTLLGSVFCVCVGQRRLSVLGVLCSECAQKVECIISPSSFNETPVLTIGEWEKRFIDFTSLIIALHYSTAIELGYSELHLFICRLSGPSFSALSLFSSFPLCLATYTFFCFPLSFFYLPLLSDIPFHCHNFFLLPPPNLSWPCFHIALHFLSSSSPSNDHQSPQHHHGKEGSREGAELYSPGRMAHYHPLGERRHGHWPWPQPTVLHHYKSKWEDGWGVVYTQGKHLGTHIRTILSLWFFLHWNKIFPFSLLSVWALFSWVKLWFHPCCVVSRIT